MVIGLFVHTADGERALEELLGTRISREAISVVGDLGAPAGSEGAMRHVTLDALHVPKEQRGMVMEAIREGGVVLAVSSSEVDVEGVLRRCGAVLVERTSEGEANPSHTPAG